MDNDYELVYSAKEENELAIELLLKKYMPLINSKIKKYSNSLKEDYLNEAKLTLYEAIFNYKDEKPFAAYLNTCLDNHLINFYKSLSRNKNKILNEAMPIINEEQLNVYNIKNFSSNPEDILLEEISYYNMIEKIKSTLTWKEELVFDLKVQNYTPKEISQIIDKNISNVYNIIRRIQNKIVKLMY